MIEIKDLLFLDHREGNEPVSFSLEKGNIFKIPYEKKELFTFLSGNFIEIESGEVLVDGNVALPAENGDDSYFTVDVDSIIFASCLFFDGSKKVKQRTNEIVTKLKELISLDVSTLDGKKNKILEIFKVILEFNPKYILVDENSYSEELKPIVDELLEKHKGGTCIAVLEKTFAEISEAKTDSNEDSPIVQFTNKEHIKNPFVRFISFLKDNLIAFLAPIIPVVGISSFSLLLPLYNRPDSKFLYYFFLISIIVYVLLFYFMVYICTDFRDKKRNSTRKQGASFFALNALSVCLGYAIGIGIFFIVKNVDKSIKTLPFEMVGLIVALCLLVLLLTANFYTYKLINPIVRLFTKKKQ